MVQVGAVCIWSYVYPIMRLSANNATIEIDSTITDNTSGETPYLEISSETLLPSTDCPTSEIYRDQAEGKAKVSSDLLLL
jgi:hypothetical protein